MSAPDTNLERPVVRPKPSIAGLSAAVAVVAAIVLALIFWPAPLADDVSVPETTTEVEP